MNRDSQLDQTLRRFLDQLASDQPTPGGGSVAALGGTLAAALGHMAAALTIGKPQFADVEPRVREIAARLKRAGELLKQLLDDDVAAYGGLHAAFRLPKSDPQRREALQAAASVAAAVPFEMVALARKLRLDLARLALIVNPQLQSDVEVALVMADAAMRAAAVMVRVNLPLLSESDRAHIDHELQRLLAPPHADPPEPA
ncbi:MAG: cyclodeaminase/cyclohydrolase family protein [Phycisphaerae bacterium]